MRGRDAHLEPVGDHQRAAGDGRAVAAGLADDRRQLAGDGRLVDRGDAFDHLTVGGDQIASLDQHDLSRRKLLCRGGHGETRLRIDNELGLGLCALTPQRFGLSLAATLGHCFGKVGE